MILHKLYNITFKGLIIALFLCMFSFYLFVKHTFSEKIKAFSAAACFLGLYSLTWTGRVLSCLRIFFRGLCIRPRGGYVNRALRRGGTPQVIFNKKRFIYYIYISDTR